MRLSQRWCCKKFGLLGWVFPIIVLGSVPVPGQTVSFHPAGMCLPMLWKHPRGWELLPAAVLGSGSCRLCSSWLSVLEKC